MSTGRELENARTLASILKIDTEEAARLLDIGILITFDTADHFASALASHLRQLLSRTVRSVHENVRVDGVNAEVVIGDAEPFHPDAVRVTLTGEAFKIGKTVIRQPISPRAPKILLIVVACYAAGMALKAALGPSLQVGGPSPDEGLNVPIASVLGSNADWCSREIHLEETYVAGAGAVGNAFLYALAELNVSGTLHILDPDTVTDGNLNRCVWFDEKDLTYPKVTRLVAKAQPQFSRLKLIEKDKTLQQFGKTQASATWLRRLVVGVDSPRARRTLQLEIAREVFDASTTGVAECVLHHHLQPTANACMACIYHETPDELSRERHIADALGVNVDDVKEHYVSSSAATRICEKYSGLAVDQIVGQAYDSLFKVLCGQQKLYTAENRQVLAPFAFVSVLAGAYLAIDLARCLSEERYARSFNYWRVSPWAAPVEELKQTRGRNPQCEFCCSNVLLRTAKELWGESEAVAGRERS